MESADRVEANNWACLIAWGYAWKSGGGSQAADERVGLFGEVLDEDFVDFGLGLIGVLCFTDFDLIFIRECLLAGLAGVTGVGGIESKAVPVLLIDMLRGRADSATFGRSDIGGAVFDSSSTGDTTVFSALLRVNIPRRPPFDSLR
jgi:hypothetical protein